MFNSRLNLMMPEFKDHFSQIAASYAAFRPMQPPAVISWAASLPPRHDVAWDCGTGNGQAARGLAEFFSTVIATDASETQIAHATPHSNVQYRVAPAEASGLDAHTVDLVTVAQALHWFDHPKFYDEVRRVSRPGALIIAWTYLPSQMEGKAGAIHDRLMFETLRDYWPPERRHVEAGYRGIPFPFERLEVPELRLEECWPLIQLTGYMRTWSASARYRKLHGVDPVVEVERELSAVWGNPEDRRAISWPLVVLAGRV